MFGGGAGGASAGESKQQQQQEEEDPLRGGRPDANGVFGDVFEDMYVCPPPHPPPLAVILCSCV